MHGSYINRPLMNMKTQLKLIYEVYGIWWGTDYSANVVPPRNATMFSDTLLQVSWDRFQSPLCTIFRYSTRKKRQIVIIVNSLLMLDLRLVALHYINSCVWIIFVLLLLILVIPIVHTRRGILIFTEYISTGTFVAVNLIHSFIACLDSIW